ncbi:MAG: prephenate dehydrogenase/arogenate dehydrogenase family protein, partial [Lachnospiraceae bacterium]|nr:prephenate dehydrogenase/arogenate dehydrogenase family protein [Lachnospiraceae bacterium]
KLLLEQLETIPMEIPGEKHDIALAAVSHLPHVVSAVLTNAVKEADDKIYPMPEGQENASRKDGLTSLTAGGFKDITRISSSSPSLWAEISLENQKNILELVENFQKGLENYKKLLEAKDQKGLEEFFQTAKTYRDSIL